MLGFLENIAIVKGFGKWSWILPHKQFIFFYKDIHKFLYCKTVHGEINAVILTFLLIILIAVHHKQII